MIHKPSYNRGWYNALDKVLNYLQGLSPEEMTPDEMKRRAYIHAMGLIPDLPEEAP